MDIADRPELCITIQKASPDSPRIVWYRKYMTLSAHDGDPEPEPWVDVALALEELGATKVMTHIHRARSVLSREGYAVLATGAYIAIFECPKHTNYDKKWASFFGQRER